MSAPSPSPDPDFLAFQDAVAGEYSLERELGRGGMGIVYLAREVALDRPVAVKVLPPALAMRDTVRERFLREARTAAQLSHPHIVPIFRVGEVAARDGATRFVYFAMAYVDGETLGQRVRARGPLPVHEAVRVLREVAWALAYAHARGIVHRDVKPDNILLEAGTGRALVTDFGIARVAAGAELTDEGSIVGTAQYMSPEQGASSQVDGRSDLYALGVVAHLALAGRLPFEGESAASLLAMHLARPAPSLLERAPAVPRRIADAVDRCLAKQPTDRWATGEAFADALDAATPARREVPAPLRVWLSRGMALRPLYLIWSTPLTMIVATHLLATHEPFARQAVLLAAPWVFHALLRAQETRRVLGEGFTLPDLRLALDLDADRQREERRAENAAGPSPFGRLVRVVAYLGLATAAGVAAALSVGGRLVETVSVVTLLQIFAVASTVAIGGALLGLGLPGRRLEKESVLTRLRRQFWKSRLGQWYVAALEPARSRPRALAGALQRPTELAIGLAVDDLYDALPKRAREEARTLPALARRLEGEAQAMRARVAELDERIGEAERGAAAPLVVGSWDAGRADALAAQRSTLVADLRAAREGAGRRLALAVAALESLRLDLLRLHAGAGDLGSLTATLAAAERVGAEIDAMMGGHAMPRDDASSREPTRA